VSSHRTGKTVPNKLKIFLGPLLGIVAVLVTNGTARAQMPLAEPQNLWQHSLVGADVAAALNGVGDDVETPMTPWTSRIPMFRMLPGFLVDPPDLNVMDDPSDNTPGTTTNADNGVDGFVLNFGDDNPYFDPRRPGDPGGVGFVRVHSQVQVLDSGSTSVCFGLRAWTPAGLENGGVQNGSTVFAPGIGVFQDLGAGSGLHGFVDQNLHSCCRQGPVHCGMAVDCPVNANNNPANTGLFVFVQALGTMDYGIDRQGRAMNWELVPGVQWRLSDSFSMSLGASKSSILTCWWHF
jgi:hypothetical protein